MVFVNSENSYIICYRSLIFSNHESMLKILFVRAILLFVGFVVKCPIIIQAYSFWDIVLLYNT